MKFQNVAPFVLVFALVLAACGSVATPTEAPLVATEEAMEEDMAEEELMDIVDTAIADGRFATLVTAVQEAGLVEALKADGPLTVFAPTDDAFAALPEGTIEALLADIPALTDILLFHVVEGKVMAEAVVGLASAQTLQGQYVDIVVEGGSVFVNGAEVIITDIETSNGVIHVIDAVILPESRDIVDIAVEDGRFTTLVAAVQAADLVDALKAEGPLTVFAPTDEAFAALPEGTIEALLADIPALTDILLYHVVEGKLLAGEVVTLSEATTLLGETVSVRVEMGNVYINEAQIIITDIEAANGVIHVIDAVILPAS